MTRRELVKAAIGHRQTARVPYAIDLTSEAVALIQRHVGAQDVTAWVDNDVHSVGVPWW